MVISKPRKGLFYDLNTHIKEGLNKNKCSVFILFL